MAGRENILRKRFLASFGFVFLPTSPTMAQKCWRSIQRLIPERQQELVDALETAAWSLIDATPINEALVQYDDKAKPRRRRK